MKEEKMPFIMKHIVWLKLCGNEDILLIKQVSFFFLGHTVQWINKWVQCYNAFSAAEVMWESNFFCGPSPQLFLYPWWPLTHPMILCSPQSSKLTAKEHLNDIIYTYIFKAIFYTIFYGILDVWPCIRIECMNTVHGSIAQTEDGLCLKYITVEFCTCHLLNICLILLFAGVWERLRKSLK